MVGINLTDISIAVAIIAGIVGVFRVGGLPKQYAPIVALIVGIVYSVVVPVTLIIGIVAGLSASGSWKLGQKVIGGTKVIKNKLIG